jgi:flagellar M-ring protein FliF
MNKVTEFFSKIGNLIKEKWTGMTKSARIILLSILSSVVVAIVVLAVIFSKTGYAPLYTYTEANSAEMNEVVTALNDAGITEVKIQGLQILVPEKQIDQARMEMAVQGFPRSTFNFDRYNDTINIFSTETEKTELKRQQLTYNLMSALNTIKQVESSKVIITPEAEDPYVLETDKQPSTVAVMLKLKEGEKLTSDQIEGVYWLVLRSVAGLSRDNIALTDGNGIPLIPKEAPDAAETMTLENERIKMQTRFERELEKDIKTQLTGLLEGSEYKRFTIATHANLDFGKKVTQSTEYTPSVNEQGTRGGMVSNEQWQASYGGTPSEGGVVGTTTNADISPDFPTINYEAGKEAFYDALRKVEYKVNELKTQYESGPFEIKKISAAVTLDGTAMSDEETLKWQNLFANAIGTTPENVSVIATPFSLSAAPETGDISLAANTANRNMLIFIIVALGALLIALLFLAIMTSGSKKRRHIRARGQVAATPSSPSYEDLFGPVTTVIPEPEEDFGVQSLTGDGTETKESVLKGEIRDFAKTNPDIVAQLIKLWMKE